MNTNSKRMHLVANAKSGKGMGGTLHEVAERVCRDFGCELVRYDTSEGIDEQAQIAVAAAEKDEGVVVAAGGDGTIRAVAQAAHGKNVKFAVVACGTFNFFARTHNIPEEQEDALRLALTGEVRPVRLGKVNGEVFLINASLGLYVKAIREREKRTSRFGRNRLVASLSTILTLLSGHRLLNVTMLSEGKSESLKTPMIFIGNNALQLRDLAFDVARCMKRDLLAVVMLKPLTKLEAARVILRGIMRTIEKESRVDSFCVDSLTIHTKKLGQTVALDGEIFKMTSPLNIEAVPGALQMVLPPKKETPP